MSPRPFPKPRADAVAKELLLDLNIGICHACLGIVASSLEYDTPAACQGAVMRMTPMLWDEGLAEPALAAVRAACERGIPDADLALADLERRGGSSGVARAIVRRLAAELSADTRTKLRLERLARDRLALAPPQWN
jgi:hypothetical protein